MINSEKYILLKRKLFDKAYENLNECQREALFTVNNPLLVLAGAGSGKTTVLVQRIAYMIRYGNAYYSNYVPYDLPEKVIEDLENGLKLNAEDIKKNILPNFAIDRCEPYRILAITFTNKAAAQIKERLEKMFPEDATVADSICTGTFHSICVRILRTYGNLMGYRPGFTIYDIDDSKKALADAMKRCNIDDKLLPVKAVQNAISRAKDKLLTADDYAAENNVDYRLGKIASVYETYQQILKENNALDFDDLIMQTVFLLQNHQEVREHYQNRFKYVCVDEYQDTNIAQFELCRLLSDKYRNIMVVGDDDQSIYKFRGATIENILSFDKSYAKAKIIRLEQNYRSTHYILDAANAIISHNEKRKGKELWTSVQGGDKIILEQVYDQLEEGKYISNKIMKDIAKNNTHYKDYAILYRTNAQSSSIEKALFNAGIPYRVLGGIRFADRKEIKDVISYLQLINNHDDNLRLQRIINEPKRGIGNTTLEAIENLAIENGCSQFHILETADQYVALKRSVDKLLDFAEMINVLTEESQHMSLDNLYNLMLDRSGYREALVLAGKDEKERLENIEELRSRIQEYMDDHEEPSLQNFLEETALVADVDRYDENADTVVLMTIHSAKGLEFPYVFLPGMEDGLFPSLQSTEAGNDEIEEERRLAYVAVTRAKKNITILYTQNRTLYGRTMFTQLSRFAKEIPSNLVLHKMKETPYESDGRYSNRTNFTMEYSHKVDYYHEAPSFKRESPIHNSIEQITIGKKLVQNKSGNKITFVAGDRVRHQLHGEGYILSAKPMGTDILYEIAFDKVGTKKIMGSYATLEKI